MIHMAMAGMADPLIFILMVALLETGCFTGIGIGIGASTGKKITIQEIQPGTTK